MLMMLVIMSMLMLVFRGFMAMFMAVVAVGHFLVFVLMSMLFLVGMLMGVMAFVVAVFVGVLSGLVGVLITRVAVGHFLVHVLMFMFVFILAAHRSFLLCLIWGPPERVQAQAPPPLA